MESHHGGTKRSYDTRLKDNMLEMDLQIQKVDDAIVDLQNLKLDEAIVRARLKIESRSEKWQELSQSCRQMQTERVKLKHNIDLYKEIGLSFTSTKAQWMIDIVKKLENLDTIIENIDEAQVDLRKHHARLEFLYISSLDKQKKIKLKKSKHFDPVSR